MKTHFIGLGGIGMSALARIELEEGRGVQGSDAKGSPLLEELKKEGAFVYIGHSDTVDLEGATVVYSSSIQGDNIELKKAKELKRPLLHRSEFLAQLLEGKKPLFVTGTHGKTTTTALLSEVLMQAGVDPSFVIGGVLKSLKKNGKSGKGEYFVVEADESDGSFLKGRSFGAIVTNLEKEHLDYWKKEEALIFGFETFLQKVEEERLLFWCKDDPNLNKLKTRGISYGFSPEADLRVVKSSMGENGAVFDLFYKGRYFEALTLSLTGNHNVLNGAAVFGLAWELGIAEGVIRKAFQGFCGVERRLEKKGEAHRLTLYDDYAHHPTEIQATLKALREKVRERRIVAIFQPHRYSRVEDHQEAFSLAFDEADLVLMTEIYGAGEKPIRGLSNRSFFKKMRERLKEKIVFIPKEELAKRAAAYLQPFDVAITLGAGDITSFGEPILEAFRQRAPKLKAALLFGGRSPEWEVSKRSAQNFFSALDRSIFDVLVFEISKKGEWFIGTEMGGGKKMSTSKALSLLQSQDVALPIFHGPFGEDGMIQGLLDTLQVPYIGADYRGSAVAMQKAWTKEIALLNGVPTPPFIKMDLASYRQDKAGAVALIEASLDYPVWVKASHMGSSIGVTRVERREEVVKAIEAAFAVDDHLIVEKEVLGRQIEFSLLGNDWVRIAEPAEILNDGAFYDYEKKYGVNAAGVEIPANISSLQEKVGKELAKTMYRAANLKGLSRIDFFLDKEGHFWLNEINPMPGFTATSGYPKMWEASGLKMEALVEELVILALQKSRRLKEVAL